IGLSRVTYPAASTEYLPLPLRAAGAPVPCVCCPVKVYPPLPSKVIDPIRLRASVILPEASVTRDMCRKLYLALILLLSSTCPQRAMVPIVLQKMARTYQEIPDLMRKS